MGDNLVPIGLSRGFQVVYVSSPDTWVLLCIRLLDSAGKATRSATKTVAVGSAMSPLVTARLVGSGRGFGGRLAKGKHVAGKLRPVDVERETGPVNISTAMVSILS